jgi:Damage-control phosphatase ARMT1-like domain
MPQQLRDEFSGKSAAHPNSGSSAMVFVKGDANYRRLLGDRTWALDTPFSDVVSYFPVPVCALRTLKAEVSCYMSSVFNNTLTVCKYLCSLLCREIDCSSLVVLALLSESVRHCSSLHAEW